MMTSRISDLRAPVLAGLVATVTGTAASMGIVLTGFNAIGATQSQSISMVAIMLALYGGLSVILSWIFKMPISIVWSSPGAALLLASGTLNLGFQNAVGAFVFTGVMLTLTGLWPALGRLVMKIPKSIASAMLAGVIYAFCVAPFVTASQYWQIILPVLVVWLVLYRVATVWAAPAAILLCYVLISIQLHIHVDVASVVPHIELVTPTFSLQAILGIGIPLYLVTMASQNVPGIAIMKSFGYEVPFRSTMVSTGAGTLVATLFGGYAINLAAITAAINANEHAHKNPARRWVASVAGGVFYLVMAVTAGAIVSFVLQVPHELLLASSGIALFATIASAFANIVEVPDQRLGAVIAFLVGSSGVSFFGIGSAFWALLAGILVWQALTLRTRVKA
jgi:benzoate membrane transport protein